MKRDRQADGKGSCFGPLQSVKVQITVGRANEATRPPCPALKGLEISVLVAQRASPPSGHHAAIARNCARAIALAHLAKRRGKTPWTGRAPEASLGLEVTRFPFLTTTKVAPQVGNHRVDF